MRQTQRGNIQMNSKRKLHSRLFVVSAIALLLSVSGRPASAWNPYGHMAVACVGYKNMTAQARARATQLLKLNPYYEQWKKQAGDVKSDDELNLRVFMLAATWPDVIKGDKSFTTDGAEGGFRPSGPSASQNTGYDDKQLHMYWHFYDKPFSDNKKAALPTVPTPNSETQMAAFRKVLSSTDASDELKSYDLTWLIHVVGDIHQPLHNVARISDQYPNGDNGGNLVKLTCPDCPSKYNLHWFWDGALGSSGDPKVIPDPNKVIETASHFPKVNKKASENLDVDTWIQESFKIAQNSIYKPLGKTNGPFELSEKYKAQSKTIAEKQGELGGERLANLLNKELK